MYNSRDLTDLEQQLKCLYYLVAAGILLLDNPPSTDESQEPRNEEVPELLAPPRKRRTKSLWVNEWLTRRHIFGQYDQLLTELHKEDSIGYKNFPRITSEFIHE